MAALVVDAVVLAIVVPIVANGAPSLWASIAGEAPGWLETLSQLGAACLPILYFGLCW